MTKMIHLLIEKPTLVVRVRLSGGARRGAMRRAGAVVDAAALRASTLLGLGGARLGSVAPRPMLTAAAAAAVVREYLGVLRHHLIAGLMRDAVRAAARAAVVGAAAVGRVVRESERERCRTNRRKVLVLLTRTLLTMMNLVEVLGAGHEQGLAALGGDQLARLGAVAFGALAGLVSAPESGCVQALLEFVLLQESLRFEQVKVGLAELGWNGCWCGGGGGRVRTFTRVVVI